MNLDEAVARLSEIEKAKTSLDAEKAQILGKLKAQSDEIAQVFAAVGGPPVEAPAPKSTTLGWTSTPTATGRGKSP